MNQQITRSDKIISRIKNNPILASIIVLGIVVIALSTFTDAAKNLLEKLDIKVPKAPKLIFLGLNNKLLDGQNIKAELVNKSGQDLYFTFSAIEKNEGTSITHPIFLKIYTSDPLILSSISTDEPGFQYENVPDQDVKELPPDVGLAFAFSIKLHMKEPPPLGKYPALLKAHYGDEKAEPARAKFNLDFTRSK